MTKPKIIAISTDVTAVETDHRGLDQAGLSDHADDGTGKTKKRTSKVVSSAPNRNIRLAAEAA
jgi:hypothetical protein